MIGPNVITLGGSWPECQTTTNATLISSQKRKCPTEDAECAENNQDGGEIVLAKKRRNIKKLNDSDCGKGRAVSVAAKNINNNLVNINHETDRIINHGNDRIISDETVLIIDANFGSISTTTCSTTTETVSSFSDSSMPSLEDISSPPAAAADVQTGSGRTGSVSVQTGSALNPLQPEAVDNPNLSWLLDFKVSSLFDPDGSEGDADGDFQRGAISPQTSTSSHSSQSSPAFTMPPPPPVPHPSTTNRLLKPPFTYTELIEQALKEKGQLTVSGIYNWMSEKFPFFKAHDERWKNSVRHNLSINPHFRKGMKASQGSGHFWTLSTQGAPPPNQDSWKIAEVKSLIESQETEKSYIDEVATATASIEEQEEERFSPPLSQLVPDPSLARTAEEILSGVKKEVQVQYLSADSDFLNHMTRNGLSEETNLTEVSTSFLMNDLGSEVILNDSFFCDDLNFQYCELTTAQM